MEIVTWNINGLRAALNKGVAEWWNEHDPDVLCLQEIKAMPEQLTVEQHAKLKNFYAVWNPAIRKGYSGVATFTREIINEVRLGIGNELFDREGRVIQMRFDSFVLFNVYFPNGQRDHGRLQYKLDFYENLLHLCDQLHESGDQIIITGDFNTAHEPIDLTNPKQNGKTSGFLPVERAWIDRYLAHGFVDVYRKLHPNLEEYTWWTYRVNARARNIGWRLDYFLVSVGLVDRVVDVKIYGDVMGSDHCPVGLRIL